MSKILIVAGHGAGDSGAVGNGYQEADLTRKVAIKLYEKLKNILDIELFDTNKNLYQYRKKNKFDFSKFTFVFEIHFNSAGASATGTELLVKTGTTIKEIDKRILKSLVSFGFADRGYKFRSDLSNMNGAAASGTPYTLAEICFISNKNDMKIFNNNFEKICSKIANDFVKVFGNKNTFVELTEINDIVWEYAHRGIITESEKWKRKAEQDGDIYWLLRKNLNFIRRKGF